MKFLYQYTKEQIVDIFTTGIIYTKNINPLGMELVCFFGNFSDANNFEAIHRFVSDNLDELRENNPSEYFEDHFDDLVDRLRQRLEQY